MLDHNMLDHNRLIGQLVHLAQCKTYLELGVHDGSTFNLIVPLVERAIGVDIVDKRIIKKGEFYQETTDAFFKHFTDPVDVVFIDADHRFKSVRKDLYSSLGLLSPHGFIILHDTDPDGEKWLAPGYCGDSYKIVDYVRQNMPQVDITTLPLSHTGMSFLARKNTRRVLEFV